MYLKIDEVSLKRLKRRIREEVRKMKGVRVKEGAFGRRRIEVRVNDLKFFVGINDEVLKFSGEGRKRRENV